MKLNSEEKQVLEFPDNEVGLERGSFIRSLTKRTKYLGVPIGGEIPIGYDGKYIRCSTLTWSISDLVEEILAGVWEVTTKKIDFSREGAEKWFKEVIELR